MRAPARIAAAAALAPAVVPAGHAPMLRTPAPVMYQPATSMKELIRELRYTADELDCTLHSMEIILLVSLNGNYSTQIS